VNTDIDFDRTSEGTLERLNRALDVVAEEHEVEVLYQSGVLTLEVEEPIESKIVISPNSSAGQIWISAQSTSFKLDWSSDQNAFVFRATGEALDVLVGRLIAEELGVDPITLPR
jgi:iron donor protein CyaY